MCVWDGVLMYVWDDVLGCVYIGQPHAAKHFEASPKRQNEFMHNRQGTDVIIWKSFFREKLAKKCFLMLL
jgi:hypothetical protein